jgi:hypothetical protein
VCGGSGGALSVRCRKAVVDVLKMGAVTTDLLTKQPSSLPATPALCSAAVEEAGEVGADLISSCSGRWRRRGSGEAFS